MDLAIFGDKVESSPLKIRTDGFRWAGGQIDQIQIPDPDAMMSAPEPNLVPHQVVGAANTAW